MTTTVFTMPINGIKPDIVRTDALANTTTLDGAVPSGSVGVFIDDATIDLALIQSGLVYVAILEMLDRMIENSALYTTMSATSAFAASCFNENPKLTAHVEATASPNVTTIDGVMQSLGNNIAVVWNEPVPNSTGLGYTAGQRVADYIREQIP